MVEDKDRAGYLPQAFHCKIIKVNWHGGADQDIQILVLYRCLLVTGTASMIRGTRNFREAVEATTATGITIEVYGMFGVT
jgi:hypothetical protein